MRSIRCVFRLNTIRQIIGGEGGSRLDEMLFVFSVQRLIITIVSLRTVAFTQRNALAKHVRRQ